MQYWLSTVFILPAHGGHQFTRPSDEDEVEVEDADADAAEKFETLDAAAVQVLMSETLDGEVHSVSWSTDGTKIACGDWNESLTVPDAVSGTVTVLDAASGEVAWSQALRGWVRSVSWSADGTKIACGDKAKFVTVLDVASGEVAWSSKKLGGEVNSVSWSTDGTKIA